MHRILVLGGYGFFGARIAADLVRDPSAEVLIAGRDSSRAKRFARTLGLPDDHGVAMDAASREFAPLLRSLGVNTLINTAGPFQDQDYKVASDAIEAGANYIDLADGRRFVAGIDILDRAASAKGLVVVSGASSVPGLSSAVVDEYAPAFARMDSVRLGIASGARAPGLATVRAVFGYCGKPIQRLVNGTWEETHGWLDTMRYKFPGPVGRRWLGSCDVPDLELLPKRYASLRTVTFHAGFASDLGHLLVWAMAGLVKAGILPGLTPLAGPLNRLARWLEPFLSDKGAMFVEIDGISQDGKPAKRRWCILAMKNHGPYIPCGAAIALAGKLARGDGIRKGAQPCMGLLTVDEYLAPLRALDIHVIADPA